jgi:hypothetical protein
VPAAFQSPAPAASARAGSASSAGNTPD